MERQEALAISHDVLDECAGSVTPSCVLLTPVFTKSLEEQAQYEVRIACSGDDDLKRGIETIINKHKLEMRQRGKAIILYRPKE